MTLAADPKQLMAEHLSTLRQYAKRLLVQDDPLSSAEDADRASRMREYLAVGASFQLTEHEMVDHLSGITHIKPPGPK